MGPAPAEWALGGVLGDVPSRGAAGRARSVLQGWAFWLAIAGPLGCGGAESNLLATDASGGDDAPSDAAAMQVESGPTLAPVGAGGVADGAAMDRSATDATDATDASDSQPNAPAFRPTPRDAGPSTSTDAGPDRSRDAEAGAADVIDATRGIDAPSPDGPQEGAGGTAADAYVEPAPPRLLCPRAGLLCGSDTILGDPTILYCCKQGEVGIVAQVCATQCQVLEGTNDRCPSQRACPSGPGAYCGGHTVGGCADTLYQCTPDGRLVNPYVCPNGCKWNRPEFNDSCR
jgi:hypothetical protein